MKRLKHEDLEFNGLKQITFLDEFVYIVDNYSKTSFVPKIEKMGFKMIDSRTVGRDFEISEYNFRRITPEEKNESDLEYQINKLEIKFNIKINYIQNEK